MKSIASLHSTAFFSPSLPMAGTWNQNRRRTVRPAPHLPLRFALDTDELAASKQEVVCGGILALCLFYTLAQVVAQLAF